MYSDEFIKELNRRADWYNSTVQQWFGVKNATKEEVNESIKKDEVKYRWDNKLPPLLLTTNPKLK